jgi:hypothetical protein
MVNAIRSGAAGAPASNRRPACHFVVEPTGTNANWDMGATLRLL